MPPESRQSHLLGGEGPELENHPGARRAELDLGSRQNYRPVESPEEGRIGKCFDCGPETVTSNTGRSSIFPQPGPP